MHIILEDNEIKEDTGFSPSVDIFKRKSFGERLANLIDNTQGNPVIALDSSWGEGKSTFIKMWRGYLSHHRENKIKSIYFDAFENDYQKDPFLALATEIYKEIKSDDVEKMETFQNSAVKAMKSLARGSIKLAVKTVTANIVDGSVIDSVEAGVSTLVADQVDEMLKEKFKHAERDRMALSSFKACLSDFAKTEGDGKQIVFIIDELDRCRPDFALSLLESIKHLFSVPGITFLLVTNRTQLEESIRSQYGTNVDAFNYLHKFVNLWLSMPRLSGKHQDHGCDYLRHLLSRMGKDPINTNSDKVLIEIVRFYQPSFREIERILSYYAVLTNMMANMTYCFNYQCAIALVSYMKACKPKNLKMVGSKLNKELFCTDLMTNKYLNIESTALQRLYYLIEYEFSGEAQREELLARKHVMYDDCDTPVDTIHIVNEWINGISTD